MVWVYERPIKSKRHLAIYHYLMKSMKDKESAFLFVKLLSLGDFLRTSHFKSPAELRESAFYDEAKTKPVFDSPQSQKMFRIMRQSGGASTEGKVFDHGIRMLIAYVRKLLPNIVVNVSDAAYPYLTILKSLEKTAVIGPWVGIVKESAVQLGTTAIVTADTVAADVGGPVGEAMVAVPAALAGMGVVATHIAADELGDALIASFLIIPFIGPILYKAATSVGKVASKVEKGGGNGLSSQTHRIYKWRMKTRRN